MITRRQTLGGLAGIIATGTAPAAVVRSMVAARNAAMCGGGNPYDKEVEYIQGDGIAYIDTGIFFIYGQSFDITYQATSSDAWTSICGEKSGKDLTLGAINDWSYYGSSYLGTGIGYGDTNKSHSIFNSQIRSCEQINRSFVYQWSTSHFSGRSNVSMYLFCYNKKGVPTSIFRGKIFGFSISFENSLLIDLIPVRIGTTGLMYDRVSKRTLGNAGKTGAFIVGADKI